MVLASAANRFKQRLSGIDGEAGKVLLPVMEEVAKDVMEGSVATDAASNRRTFSSLIGKLFLSAYHPGVSPQYAATVGELVTHYLALWSQCAPEKTEIQSVAHAHGFASLCEEIGSVMDSCNSATLDAYFTGPVKEHILAAKLPRSVRETLYDVSQKRAANWTSASCVVTVSRRAPPQPPQANPVQAFSQEAPNGNDLIHPSPLSCVTTVAPGSSHVHEIRQAGASLLHNCQEGGTSVVQQQAQQQQSTECQLPLNQCQLFQPQFSNPLPYSALPQQSLQHQATAQITQRYAVAPSEAFSPATGLPAMGVALQPSAAVNLQQPFVGVFSPPSITALTSQQPAGELFSAATHPPNPYQPATQPSENTNPYRRVEEMLHSLGCPELLELFKKSMIKDSILDLDKDKVQTGLKEAGFPVGAVMSIIDYLERKEKLQNTSPVLQHRSSSVPSTPSTPVHLQPPLTPVSPHQPSYGPIPQPQQLTQPQQVSVLPSVQVPPMQQQMVPGYTQPYTGTGAYGSGTPNQQLPGMQPASYGISPYMTSPGTSPRLTVRLPGQTTPQTRTSVGKDGSNSALPDMLTVNCVVCGSRDHKTEMCDQRSKRFFY